MTQIISSDFQSLNTNKYELLISNRLSAVCNKQQEPQLSPKEFYSILFYLFYSVILLTCSLMLSGMWAHSSICWSETVQLRTFLYGTEYNWIMLVGGSRAVMHTVRSGDTVWDLSLRVYWSKSLLRFPAGFRLTSRRSCEPVQLHCFCF